MEDWTAIKTEYVTTDISYRNLAKKHGVSFRTLSWIGKNEKWPELRKRYCDKVVTETIAIEAKNQIDRYERMLSLTDLLLDKIEQSIGELDIHIAKSTHKTKVIEYKNAERPDKATKEIVDEVEEITEYKSVIDRLGLKQVASAIKDLKDVQMLKSELDQQEQEARIKKLQKDAEGEDKTSEVLVTIKGGDESWQG